MRILMVRTLPSSAPNWALLCVQRLFLKIDRIQAVVAYSASLHSVAMYTICRLEERQPQSEPRWT